MEILLLNKDENFKELQKENEFLNSELTYQKKTYVKIKMIIINRFKGKLRKN